MARVTCIQKDLFDMPHGYCLAHCISEDFALGAGIAVEFEKRYNMRDRLKARCQTKYTTYVGTAIKIDNVYNLITKKRCYEKPTYNDLKQALMGMALDIDVNDVKTLAMPKIGAGLDKLRWEIVYAIILDVFRDIDVDITICFLEGDADFSIGESDLKPLEDYFLEIEE